MATALNSLSNCTVQSMTLEPNRAVTLVARHDVKVDDVAALTIGTEVTFTDTDLGKVFDGKIVKVEKLYEDGEGIQYRCAGPFRTVSKTTAKVESDGTPTTALRVEAGTPIGDAVDMVLSTLPGTVFPGGINKSGLSGENLPLIDKGGQKMLTWLDDILDKTDDVIMFEDLTGSPTLKFIAFDSQPSVTLDVGTYNVVNTSPGDLLLEGGRFGGSINEKVEAVYVEGGGEWQRVYEEFMQAELGFQDDSIGFYQYRWYLPEDERITCKYITDTDECADLCMMRIRIGGESDSALQLEIENPPLGIDETDGRRFWYYHFKYHGASIGGQFQPPQVEAWFTYTKYVGPLISEKVSTDPALAGEGDVVEHHHSMFKYTSPDEGVTVDFTPQLDAIRDALFERYSNDADWQGNIRVHVNGLNSNLGLGSSITNFSGARVHSLQYDFVARAMRLNLSNSPIRDDLRRVKQQIKDGTLEGNNWYTARGAPTGVAGCFDDIEMHFDTSGNPQAPGGEQNQGISWDCQNGICVEVSGDGGQYEKERDCQRVCGNRIRYTCVECNACVEVEDANAEFETREDCLAACRLPGDPTCPFNCDVNFACVGSENGAFANKAACDAVCFEPEGGPSGNPGSGGISGSGSGSGVGGPSPWSGSGSGPGDVNVTWYCDAPGQVVGTMVVDDFGSVVGVWCADAATGGGCESDVTETIELLCCTKCEYGQLEVYSREIQIESGCIVDTGTCSVSSEGGDCP